MKNTIIVVLVAALLATLMIGYLNAKKADEKYEELCAALEIISEKSEDVAFAVLDGFDCINMSVNNQNGIYVYSYNK